MFLQWCEEQYHYHLLSSYFGMTTDFSEKDDKAPGRDAAFSFLPGTVNEKGSVDVDEGEVGALMKDGLKLHPQPTADPLDPLNWATWRKHVILAIVMLK